MNYTTHRYISAALLLLTLAGCSEKSTNDHAWDYYARTPQADQTYIDNDEYYVAPSGNYGGNSSSDFLDVD
jgi:hypothetical protein